MRGRRLTWTTVRTAGLVLKVGDVTGVWHLSARAARCQISSRLRCVLRYKLRYILKSHGDIRVAEG